MQKRRFWRFEGSDCKRITSPGIVGLVDSLNSCVCVAMGRAKGMSLDEQKAALAQRQSHLNLIQEKRELNLILKNNPHVNKVLLEYAKNLGYTADTPGVSIAVVVQ